MSKAFVAEEIVACAQRARAASEALAELPREQKNRWLACAAAELESSRDAILEANTLDLRAARDAELEAALLGRLELSNERWETMIQGLRDVAALPDPIGEISDLRVRPNGLRVGRMRIPLGVIGIIYESRPNVTVDAAALCVKTGNAVILRGGSEAIHSNLALVDALRQAAEEAGIPADAIIGIPTTDRAAIGVLLKQDRLIDLIIPRGGPGLIRMVSENSRIPVIKHDAGVCHVVLDESADTGMAESIVLDSKLRQMGVCNGLETLLVHRGAAARLLPGILKALAEAGVEIRGCAQTQAIFPAATAADESDWPAEFLAPILAVRIVEDLDEAIAHIRRFGSDHTEVIVTDDYHRANEFVRRVNSSTVGVNCSTAFADGYRLGLGAEIGISTSKLHAYGPMGLEGLTAQKFVLFGEGQLRE